VPYPYPPYVNPYKGARYGSPPSGSDRTHARQTMAANPPVHDKIVNTLVIND
jgi:hypothetical protein